MTYPWPTLMPMGIVVISCVRPSVQPSMGLGLCIAYKALGRNGLQFGMVMYPDGLHSAFMDAYGYCCWSVCPFVRLRHFLVDTGDICCHYWQHILFFKGNGFIFLTNICICLYWSNFHTHVATIMFSCVLMTYMLRVNISKLLHSGMHCCNRAVLSVALCLVPNVSVWSIYLLFCLSFIHLMWLRRETQPLHFDPRSNGPPEDGVLLCAGVYGREGKEANATKTMDSWIYF